MATDFVLEPIEATDKRRGNRLPADLPVATGTRRQLELALRKCGYRIKARNPEPPSNTDTAQLRAELEALVNQADPSQITRLEQAATTDPSTDDLDEKFWGAPADAVSAVEAVVADLGDQFGQRRQLVAESISRTQAAQLLGIAPQSITAKLESHTLIGIRQGREWRLPRWQFDPDNISGVLPDLDVLQELFPGGPVSLSRWMTRPTPDFDGLTPREQMIKHGSHSVISLAQALTATGW